MPSTTGISAVPSGRPGVEAQAGFVPGYFLSSATYDDRHRGDVIGQLVGLIEPDRWIGAHGLIAGARSWGQYGDHAFEPFLGLRHRIDDDLALAVIGHGTVMRGAERGASYRATRAGGEVALDARVLAPVRWFALHGQAAVSATYLDARGTYCADPEGAGVDCDRSASDRVIDGSIRGLFAAATATLAIELGRMPDSSFHSLRLALLGAAGTMPQVRNGMETDAARYVSLGLTLTLGLGNPK
ncbi:MAG TPA: hypothetical protein VFK02_00990 [Kofleriaceae bacterium]|nr:hypothetical protein [Kofleriaceae bacterium]